jgi:hypothetical protein
MCLARLTVEEREQPVAHRRLPARRARDREGATYLGRTAAHGAGHFIFAQNLSETFKHRLT